MAALTLEIVTPERRVATLQADEVRAPGVLGGFGIRKDHTPFMSQLQAGRLTVVEGGRDRPPACPHRTARPSPGWR